MILEKDNVVIKLYDSKSIRQFKDMGYVEIDKHDIFDEVFEDKADEVKDYINDKVDMLVGGLTKSKSTRKSTKVDD